MTRGFQTLCVLSFLVSAAARNCASGDFQCPQGTCLPADNVCDFTDQCGDGSDERDCSHFERCDFERDLCNMSQKTDSLTAWTRVTGLMSTGPTHDHTGNSTAHYLSLSQQNGGIGFARLRSTVFLPTSFCQLTFYHYFGRVIIQGELFNVNDPSEALAIDDVAFGEGCVTAPAAECDFESGLCGWLAVGTDGTERPSGWKWVKAVDAVLSGSAPFEDHSNGSPEGHYLWVRADTDQLPGTVFLSSSVFHSAAPSCVLRFHYSIQGNSTLTVRLHTRLIQFEGHVAADGGFIALDSFLFSECEVVPVLPPDPCPEGTWACGDESCVPSSALCDYHPDCRRGIDEDRLLCLTLRFWYQMSEGAELALFTRTALGGVLRKQAVISQPNVMAGWIRVEVDIEPKAPESKIPFQVILQASLSIAHATVALDDISLTPECRPANTTLPGTSTDTTEHGPVVLLSKDSLSDQWGMTVDSEGWARVASVINEPAAIFSLITPGLYQGLVGSVSLQWTVSSSLYLCHSLYGPGRVSVGEIPTLGADSLRASFWLTKDKWLPGFTAMEAVGLPGHYIHRVDENIFVAKDDGSKTFRESATNDIVTPPHPLCRPPSFLCQSGECIDQSKVCDFTAHCPGGEDEAECPVRCDFEWDSCGWYEFAQGDGFDWIWSSAAAVPVDFLDQVPPQDHTTNTSEGHFMFVLKNSSSLSQKAFLRGPKYQQSASGCTMTFWHYNYGHSVGAADMYLRIDGVENITVLWRTLYNQGDRWHQVTVQLGRITQPFQISLAKLSLGFFDGVSALDDITFHNCSLPPPAAHCHGHDHFHCKRSRACIDRLLRCDLVDDCGDGSDEEGCSPELMCNFEEGLCDWTQDKQDDVFDWTRIQGPTPTLNTGPWKDHTLGNVNGHYLFIEASAPQEFKDTAVLVSRSFQPTTWRDPGSHPCLFRFHYHMFGTHVFSLAVYLRTTASSRGQLLWARYGDQGNLWHRKILFLSSNRPFQVLVEGTVGDDFNGDIAIDDLSFLDCVPYDGDLPSEVPTTPPGVVTPPTIFPNSCLEGEMVCGVSGECVDWKKRCDFRQDCSEGSDELYCVSEVCDFEGGNKCGWYQNWSSPSLPGHAFRWFTGQGKSIHHGEEYHRPATDHTHGTVEGWYMYADSSNGGYGHTTDLVTPVISATGPQCTLVFWYHMSGFTVGTLQVLIKFGNVTHELWSQSGSQGYRWRRGEVFLGIRYNFQIILRAKRGISYMGDVVVDDVSFQNCAPLLPPDRPCGVEEYTCANKYCIPKDSLCDFIDDCGDWSDENPYICKGFEGRCNFEFDLCLWRQCTQDDFDWLIKAGSTPTGGTGPSTDHTLRDPSGHYIYLESSFPQATGNTARISGPTFSRQSKQCKMIFYVHMSGDSIGALNIFQVTGSQHLLLLNLTGDQGNYWQRREVSLVATEDFHVTFEGKIGKGTKGDICLDDITFTSGCLLSSSLTPLEPTGPPPSGSCPRGYLECANGKCFHPKQSCDFVDDCGDATDERDCGTSCTFETGRCGWKNSLADNFDWTLGTGSVQSFRPHFDHTLESGDGHFVYLEATPVGFKGDKAHMRSSVWKESSTTCQLSFWYYISSKATGIIRLLAKTDSGLTEVWNKTGDQGERWNKAEVPLRKMRNFQLIFEGIRARDVSGGAALDDLQFSNCAPSSELPASCPAPTDFVCQNGDCIESHLLCDSKADCADESDEIDCSHILGIPGACNFNMPEYESWENTCQLTQNDNDDFDWKIGSTRVTPGTGPPADHSQGGKGQFLYAYSAVQREGDITAITTSTPFPASIGVCHLRFWYYMYGSHRMGSLKVYTVGESGTNLLMWAVTGNQGDKWNYANVVLSNNGPFRVTFEAEVGGDVRTDIALDDISFTAECVVGGPVTPEPPTCGGDTFQCTHAFQCIPVSWLCDGEADCNDMSDEEQCPTRVPGTLPPQTQCGEGYFQCCSGNCISSLLRCDGVPDCYAGEDEFGCPLLHCADGALTCERTASCIPRTQRCDGVVDCPSFRPDESSCHECPSRYCKNGGVCHLKKQGPVCRCSRGWRGNRCHIRAKPTSPTSSPEPEDTGLEALYAVLGVGLLFLVLGIIIAILMFFKWKPSCISDEMDRGVMDNPAFDFYDWGAELPTIDKGPRASISVYPWRNEAEGLDMRGAKLSFTNPLYHFPTGATGTEAGAP
ncbi:MAM and LDL-receptor class A domain-containing protein 1 [Megalops cyprinoides]|uniref:MAM and LDL-receptor class A domain-containing protein 1 n=1 Tax=Megalops cyprinoides TaxID=118141 RepID=UPI0018646B01|nr:MAM and LDL-receptor class A domain-containing protein 1 [Megalops cyprinoides]